MLSLKKQEPKTRPKKKRWGEEAIRIMHSEDTEMHGYRAVGRTRIREREVAKKAEQDGMALRTCVWGRLTTSSSWWAQTP